MKLQYYCVECQMQRHFKKAAQIPDKGERLDYIMSVMRIMTECGDAPAPVSACECRRIEEKYLGISERYTRIKQKYNAVMLGLESRIEEQIEHSADPLETAIKYARAGNYIDFDSEKEFSESMLFDVLDRVANEQLDRETYDRFIADMNSAKTLVYITDNCGEIVLDKLLVKRLRTIWPELKIWVMVRGGQAVNDATREDAGQVGMNEVTDVVDTGSDITGAWMPVMSREARGMMESADVIISKGQANMECLCGCGLNIYYLLLCKCERFVTMFEVERYTGMFINETDAGRKL